MAKKRKVFIHVDLGTGTSSRVEQALFSHRHALAALGVRVAPDNAGEMFLAAVEMTRTHRSWGYKRKEVEGVWARICRRILKAKGRDDFVVSQSLLAGAAPEQIDLLVDTLPGLAVHVLLVADYGIDTTDAVARWNRAVRKPERLELLQLSPGQDHEHVWRELGGMVGFGTVSLPIDGRVERPLTVA